MPEVFLEFLGGASPWLLLLLIPLYFWGKLNHDSLNSRATHPESFERVIGWLRENNFGLLYLKALGWLMDIVSDLIGDRQKLNKIYISSSHSKGFIYKVFGSNPFTAESYDKALRLAFLYPVFSFFTMWAFGSTGRIGNLDWLNQYSENVIILAGWQRWLLFGGILFLMLGSLWFVLRWQKISSQWLASNIPFLLIGIVFAFFVVDRPILVNVFTGWFGGWGTFLLLFIPMYLGGRWTGYLIHHSVKEAHDAIYNIAFSFAFSVAIAVVFAITAAVVGVVSEGGGSGSISHFNEDINVAVVIAFAGAFSIAAIFSGGFAIALAGTFAVAIARGGTGAFIFAVAASGIVVSIFLFLHVWLSRRGFLGWFWLTYCTLFFVLGYGCLFLAKNSSYMVLLLFFLLLPIVNAPLDWLSLGVTRGLLQAVRIGQHYSGLILIWALADLVLALVFLFLITTVMVGVTASGNAIAGEILVDIGGILQQLKDNPSDVDYWWIYFMLLSTLVPTLVHFALAGGTVTLWLPHKWRLQLADGLERDVHKTFLAWAYLTFMPVIGFVLVPGALLYFLWWLLNMHGGWLGMRLLDWAEMLAHFANPAMH